MLTGQSEESEIIKPIPGKTNFVPVNNNVTEVLYGWRLNGVMEVL